MKTLSEIMQGVINNMPIEQVEKLNQSLNSTQMQQAMEQIKMSINNNTIKGQTIMPKIICNWNVSITEKDMQPKTIYLDGSCRGFSIRTDIGSVSFDHHTGCNRSITYATCTQVLHALLQGMKVEQFEQIIIDDIDADTVMSVWLLQNPEQVSNPNVDKIVRQIGYVDAHFTNGFEMHPLHPHLTLAWNAEKTEEILNEKLQLVTDYILNGAELPPVPNRQARNGLAYGWKVGQTDGADIETSSNFQEMYDNGYDLVVMVQPLEKGNMVTIGKKNEFVMIDFDKLFAKLADLETDFCKGCQVVEPTKNWGGSSTIGGSARYEDQKQGSRLNVDFIVNLVDCMF